MIGFKSISLVMVAAVLTSACGTTVYGPRRLIQAGFVDDGGDVTRRECPLAPTSTPRTSSAMNLSHDFYDKACASLRSPSDVAAARGMMDAGITLNRARCNDFFAQRAGNQTRERVVRGLVAPVSALITGIIGIANFKTDAGRQEAVQILAIGESATVAGLELYQSEFLFGAANVNSVRTLTMRAADEHAAGILAQNVGFYSAARHLIDHQMICTPANILELAQTAIREGRVEQSTPVRPNPGLVGGGNNDADTIAQLQAGLQAESLSADMLGSLWWLSELTRSGGSTSQDTLTVIQSRLSSLPVNPVQGSIGSLTVDTALVQHFAPLIGQLSQTAIGSFLVTERRMEAKIGEAAPPSAIERTKDIHFLLPGGVAPTGRAVEVAVEPVQS